VVDAIAWPNPDAQAGDRARTLAKAFELELPGPPAPAPEPAGGQTVAAPTRLWSPTFRIAERSFVCRDQPSARIEVVVRDSAGNGMPGVRVWLLWDEGGDWAITGLIPERGSGYADFDARTTIRYAVGLGEYGMPLLSDLTVPTCTGSTNAHPRAGNWHIVVEPRPQGDRAD
jgi:hypothetical protein